MNGWQRRWKTVLWLLVVLMGGCERDTETSRHYDYKIAAIVFQEDQFFRLNELGMKAAAAKHNVDLQVGNSFGALDQEIALVEGYIAAKVNAIVISPLSVKGSVQALRQAHEHRIKVITYNGFIDAPFPEVSVESDQVELGSNTGKVAANYVATKLGGKAKVAMIEFVSQALEQGKMRPDGFRNEITQLPGVEIVTEQDAWLAPHATSVVESILTAHPDLNVIWAANEGGTVGATLAVKNRRKAGKVAVFGTDMNKQIAEFLLSEDNILQAVTGQKPYDMGHLAVEMAVRVLKGEEVPKKIYTPSVLYSRDKPEAVNQYLAELGQLSK